MNIGDLVLRLLADGSQLTPDVEKEAAKAGDAGAKTMGQRLSAGLKTNGLRAFSAVAATVFTGMTKGALELEDVQARFQAETGASADEAAHAAKVINKAAGDNRMSLGEVADAAAKVHNDLGLVGDAADKATAQFAEYARVTNQQAGAAVSAFDDILDNWGLTAADATAIMDKLVVSHQKFGGSVEESQKTLAALAPALRAANFEVDDGIALLGLFGAKGLDANVASAAFSKALTKVKSPQELKDLIADIAATKDPFERAAKAADLFGAKAGAKLANALDGVDLDSYKIGMNEAAGATDKAAAALDSGFGNQFRKLMSQAGAAVRGFGADFGPALTGAAALGSIANTISPKLGEKIGSAIVGGLKVPLGPLKKVGVKIMSAIGLGVASKAGETAIGEAVGETVGKAATNSSLLTAAKGLGLAAASAIGVGLAAGIAVLAVAKMVGDQVEKEKADLADQISGVVEEGSLEALVRARDVIKAQLESQKIFGVIPFELVNERSGPNGLDAQLARLNAEIAKQTDGIPPTVGQTLANGEPEVTAGAEAMVDGVKPAVDGAAADAKAAGAHIPISIAQGIISKGNESSDAMAALRDAMKREMNPMTEIARNIGILTSKELARGLKDGRPGVRTEAQRVQAIAENRLAELIAGGGKVGKGAAKELAAGLKSKDPQVRAAAQRVKAIVTSKLNEIAPKAGAAGASAGSRFIQSFKRSISAGGIVTIKVRTSGPGGTIGGRASGGRVQAGTPYWVNERTPNSEAIVPDTSGYVVQHADALRAIRSAAAPLGGGGDTINVNMPVTGVLRAETPADLARPMRLLAASGAISNPRRRRRVEVPTRG